MKPWQIVLVAVGSGCALLVVGLGVVGVVGAFLFVRAVPSVMPLPVTAAAAPAYQARVPAGEQPSWADWLKANDLARLVPGCQPLVRPAVRLTARVAAAELPVGQSRLGGEPDLPAEFPWPVWQKQPLAFLAQINLGEVPATARATAGLPDAGWLLFFENAEQGETAPGSYRVVYLPATASLVRRPLPAGLGAEARYTRCGVTFGTGEELPDGGEAVLNALGLSEAEADRYAATRAAMGGDEPIHKLGGHPDLIQGSMAEACVAEGGAGEWVLLAQLDSDDAAGMMWGDAGRLYYWIRRPDLAAARFDRVWRTDQCY